MGIDTLIWTQFVRLDGFVTRQVGKLWPRLPWLNASMIVIAKYTPIFMLALLVIAVSGLASEDIANQPPMWSALSAVVAAIAIRILHEPVSRWTARPRPFDAQPFQPLLVHDPGDSFPSNHAGGAMALAFGAMHLAGFYPILLVLAAALCCARIYCGLHHLSDVLVGAVGGAAMGYLCACAQLTLHHA